MSGSLLVIAPHPDDEILGAGAIMARAAADGDRIAVIVVTGGGRSDPDVDPVALAARRRQECIAGLIEMLGAAPPILFLDQPDGALASASVAIANTAPLGVFVAAARPDTILVTDPADAHPDHKAAFGLAARLLSSGHTRLLRVMPVSQRVDGVFDPAGYDTLPTEPFARRKTAALAHHASQIDRPSGFSLPAHVLADFSAYEYLRTAYDGHDSSGDAIPAAHFDAMFASSSDPWRYDDEPYERDRFRRTVAALDDRRYASGLELGCANGALTATLAPICDHLLASDASSQALAAARARVAEMPNVTLRQCRMPDEVPDGPFDLVVASDMLYYLGLEGIVALTAKLDRQASADCRLLIASYLGETDTRLTGEMSSETAIAHLGGWHRVHAERTDRLRIDVLERR